MERAYPILRIDDYEVAKRYYVGFLGFEIEHVSMEQFRCALISNH